MYALLPVLCTRIAVIVGARRVGATQDERLDALMRITHLRQKVAVHACQGQLRLRIKVFADRVAVGRLAKDGRWRALVAHQLVEREQLGADWVVDLDDRRWVDRGMGGERVLEGLLRRTLMEANRW